MQCLIRPLRRDEMSTPIDLAANEGWNPGRHDAGSFFAADPDGFLAAECGGEVVGCISAVSYAGSFGFIGLYIVVPAWRGQGIGRRLWDAGIARLAGHTVGLDGVPAQQPFYRRSGFELAWQNRRFAGRARAFEGAEPEAVVPLAAVDFAALCADDRRVFPAPREAFLRAWLAMPESTGLAWQAAAQSPIAGWGLIRRCREGHKIGPLVADDPAVASALYRALVARVPAGEAVFLDVPMPNPAAVALAAAEGLQPVFETARMVAGPAPNVELGRVYGITSFELG